MQLCGTLMAAISYCRGCFLPVGVRKDGEESWEDWGAQRVKEDKQEQKEFYAKGHCSSLCCTFPWSAIPDNSALWKVLLGCVLFFLPCSPTAEDGSCAGWWKLIAFPRNKHQASPWVTGISCILGITTFFWDVAWDFASSSFTGGGKGLKA